MNYLSRADEEEDGMDVNDQEVHRLVIVTQVTCSPVPLPFHSYSFNRGISCPIFS